HQALPAADLEHPQTRLVERQIRSHEHPHPSLDQTRLRVSLTRSPHRYGNAHPWRTQTRTARPEVTHGNVRRSVWLRFFVARWLANPRLLDRIAPPPRRARSH